MGKYLPLKAFGFETQVPRWVATLLGLILIAGIALVVYRKVYNDPERVVITLRDANRQLAAEVEEYGLHVMEEPQKHELLEEQDGKLMLRIFKDRCILIQRHTRRGVRTKLVVDLDRGPLANATRQIEPSASWMPVVFAEMQCNRGCVNPHPGQFQWRYGAQHGDWIEVWRRWSDGCEHVQLFNPRIRAWDSNPDGTAKVRWVCCVH